MEKVKNIKDVENMIRRAMWVDSKLPPVALSNAKSTLSSIVVSQMPASERPTTDDIDIWNTIMFNWLPIVDVNSREVIFKRCSGMGWKRICNETKMSYSTAKRRFFEGLNTIFINI